MVGGKVDNEKLSDNLNDAIDVYVSRVSGCPCRLAVWEIRKFICLRFFKIYMKGNEQEKKDLKNNQFMVWELLSGMDLFEEFVQPILQKWFDTWFL